MFSFTRIKLLSALVILALSASAFADSCCGLVTSKARAIDSILDQSHVEKLWLNGQHVDWQTGASDKPKDYKGSDTHSHCSSFAAAIGLKLGVYLLRPPAAPQTFLATAQAQWLNSSEGKSQGWIKLKDMHEAQTQANLGELVVAVFASLEKNKSGHIAIIRPADLSENELLKEGPREIQAGKKNYNSTTVKVGFKNHKSAYPENIQYFAHSTSISTN